MLLYSSFLSFWRKTHSERQKFAQFFNQGTWHYKSTAIAKNYACWKLILKPSIFATFSKRAWKLICSHNITDDLRSDVYFFPDILKVNPMILNDRFLEEKKFRRYQNPFAFKMPFDMRTIVVGIEERWIWSKNVVSFFHRESREDAFLIALSCDDWIVP